MQRVRNSIELLLQLRKPFELGPQFFRDTRDFEGEIVVPNRIRSGWTGGACRTTFALRPAFACCAACAFRTTPTFPTMPTVRAS